jgi:hypothetical protein
MRRQTQSIDRLAEERRSAGARASAESVDLQLEFRDENTGELLGVFGGRWDRRLKTYVGDAAQSRVIRLHVGQVDPALWFYDWLQQHIEGTATERVFDCALSGGRRGGKTAFAMSAAIAYAVACPGSIVWIVVPSDAFFAEPIAYMQSIMPRWWYSELGWPHWTFFLANGSMIVLRSGHTPRRMKQGRCDFAVINEGQAMPSQSYVTLSASIVDVGGLVMSASNPPDIGDPGDWVADLVAGVENGTRRTGVHFFFDPLRNPHIDQEALAALAEKMDPHTFDVQVRGMFLLPPDAVLHSWERTLNERDAPDPRSDITATFTRAKEGRSYDDVVGVDVQNNPWIAAVRCRLYADPKAPGDLDRAHLYGVGEAFVEAGDEVDCARQLIDLGCDGDRTLVVMDASCDWQQQNRDEKRQRPKYKGMGSMAMFRGEGYRYVVPPDDDMDSNPHIVDRIRAANARIGPRNGERRVFADPKRCKRTVESVRKWKMVKSGQPSRHSRAAHGGDAFTYVIWRFFPRKPDRSKVDVQSIKRFGGADRWKGF